MNDAEPTWVYVVAIILTLPLLAALYLIVGDE